MTLSVTPSATPVSTPTRVATTTATLATTTHPVEVEVHLVLDPALPGNLAPPERRLALTVLLVNSALQLELLRVRIALRGNTALPLEQQATLRVKIVLQGGTAHQLEPQTKPPVKIVLRGSTTPLPELRARLRVKFALLEPMPPIPLPQHAPSAKLGGTFLIKEPMPRSI